MVVSCAHNAQDEISDREFGDIGFGGGSVPWNSMEKPMELPW